jgi:hypothetical protein
MCLSSIISHFNWNKWGLDGSSEFGMVIENTSEWRRTTSILRGFQFSSQRFEFILFRRILGHSGQTPSRSWGA